MNNYMTTLSQIIPKLRARGYSDDFEFRNGCLYSKQTGKKFVPEELLIERVYRFEGDSSPDDMAVLYGISSGSGIKGIIIDAYGTYENAELGDFLRSVEVREIID